jgi:excisionase family DNA binding protein
MNSELMTTSEVAERLRVTAETVRLLIADGELAAFRVRRVYRVPRDSVEQFVQRSASAVAA